MTRQHIYAEIKKKKSFLCIGLDSDFNKIPKHLHRFDDPVFEFNKMIIDQTHQYAVAYKPNTAFYEVRGSKGWESLEKTARYIKSTYPELFLIADAKRGDIGNTSEMYAETFFKTMPFDAVTVAPYMGEDSVKPFLGFENKYVILLALTSNKGSNDFQKTQIAGGDALYETVLQKSLSWGNAENMMYVAGATNAEYLSAIRKIVPEHFLLVPGIGAQGGDLQKTAQLGLNSMCGLLVNASRSIIFADSNENFHMSAKDKAQEIQNEMSLFL